MSDDGEGPNWIHVLFGVALLIAAIWAYSAITKMETSGGSIRINVILALLYNILGKWGVVGFLSVFGLGAVWVGFSPPSSDDD
jgi:hypothetical protein